ncbi:hypothetical protein [Streptomyces lanatus]|uniref:Toxin-antitoxin system, toxin component n=1 Tax=Streptomyces lanatus TaxID=66900 RepID=A0ABV1XZU8_9ACTN|nr:hypothetical protein [Streptomyces lanatus]
MRKRSAQLIRHLRPTLSDDNLIASIGDALTQVRGRPVRLRSVPFPPGIASGVWVDRTGHDLIGYEENTDLEHQLVIIGHETWHMLEGHCSDLTAHGAAAARSNEGQPPDALAQLVALIAEMDGAELSPETSMDAPLHFAARAGAHENEHEVEAELFGYRFATDVQVALARARTAADPDQLAGRIQASMAHRVRRS